MSFLAFKTKKLRETGKETKRKTRERVYGRGVDGLGEKKNQRKALSSEEKQSHSERKRRKSREETEQGLLI